MRSVGAFEAKTHLAALLNAVAAGEQITITRHGRPVARLVPPEDTAPPDVARTIARRAERRFWTLAKVAHDVPRPIGVLLNRMSDLFFSWARRANVRAGVADVPWTRQKSN